MPTFHYTVDGEEQTTTEHTLTPTQIMQQAGVDAGTHYLVQMEGNHRVSYEGKPEEAIHMHQHMKFITIFTGPTTVS